MDAATTDRGVDVTDARADADAPPDVGVDAGGGDPDAGGGEPDAGGGDPGERSEPFPVIWADPNWSWFLVDGDACPPGSGPYWQGRLNSDPFDYAETEWICDVLGDRVARIEGDAALAGRAQGCRLIRPAPPATAGTLCLVEGDPPGLPAVRRAEIAANGINVPLAVVEADGVCPQYYAPLPTDQARALIGHAGQALCDFVGPAPTRLAPVDAAALVDCGATVDHPAPVEQTLCVYTEVTLIGGPPLLPDVEDLPPFIEAEVRRLDGEPLGRLILRFYDSGFGWLAGEMIWAGPADGGPAWQPDGSTSFELVPSARHMFEPPVGPDAIRFWIDSAELQLPSLHVPQYTVEGFPGSTLSAAGGRVRIFGGLAYDLIFAPPNGVLDVETSRVPIRFLVNDSDPPALIFMQTFAEGQAF